MGFPKNAVTVDTKEILRSRRSSYGKLVSDQFHTLLAKHPVTDDVYSAANVAGNKHRASMTIPKDQSSLPPSYSRLSCSVIGIICATGVLATVLVEATWARSQTDPTPSTKVAGDAKAGKILFDQHCVTCHGPRGHGDGLEIAGATVADLSSLRTQRKLNADLLTTIHEGRPGKVMPSWEYRLSKEQSRDVLAYLRTLRRK